LTEVNGYKEAEMRNVVSFVLGGAVLAVLSGSAFAAGDAEKGKAVFKKCAMCHQIGPDAKPLIGPPLTGVIGRKAASVADFTYSPGLKKLADSGLIWTDANLDKYLTDPKAMVPGSPMALALPDAAARADVIAYLKTFSQ
jgi:cytochrome c